MLSICAMSAGSVGYYASMEPFEEPGAEQALGRWFGRGAAALGLTGALQETVFLHLFDGRSPTGGQLVQVQAFTDGRSRQPGWDLTFSAPKSVSVLMGLCGPEHRAVLLAMHQESVAEALHYLESEAAVTRRGAGQRFRM